MKLNTKIYVSHLNDSRKGSTKKERRNGILKEKVGTTVTITLTVNCSNTLLKM